MVTSGRVRYLSATDRVKCKGGVVGLPKQDSLKNKTLFFSDHLQWNYCNLTLLYSKSLSQKSIL